MEVLRNVLRITKSYNHHNQIECQVDRKILEKKIKIYGFLLLKNELVNNIDEAY